MGTDSAEKHLATSQVDTGWGPRIVINGVK